MIGILWDLDGTLLDTLQDLTDAVNHSLGCFGYPERTMEEVRRFVGNGTRRLIDQAVPEGADPNPVFEEYQTYYSAHCQIKTRSYAGIMEALAYLGEKYPMAIVSNKPDRAVKPLCRLHFPGISRWEKRRAAPESPPRIWCTKLCPRSAWTAASMWATARWM